MFRAAPKLQEISLPKEPEEHEYLDAGVTSEVLYLNLTPYFPQRASVLPAQTNRATKLMKQVEREAGMGEGVQNPAEMVRLAKLMKKDQTVGIEKQSKLEAPISENARLKKMREERAKTLGKGWYNLTRPQMTDELLQEMTVLKMMDAAKPYEFHNRGKDFGNQEYFEIGSVVAPASAHYSDPHTSSANGSVRRSAKLGFVDALLDDQEFRKHAKRKRDDMAKHAAATQKSYGPASKKRK